MEQLVARWAHNPKVAGSSPAPATKKRSTKGRPFLFPYKLLFGGDLTLSQDESQNPASKSKTVEFVGVLPNDSS